MIKYKDTIY